MAGSRKCRATRGKAIATTCQFSLPPRRGKTVYIGRRTGNCARIPLGSLTSVSLLWLPDIPGSGDRRLALRSRLPLESSAPVSLRWLQENQGQHCCQCGCGEAIRLRPRHYWRVPRYVHGHQNRRGHWRVLQLKQAGYLTTSDVARALGIGVTTLLRREGTIYPRAARIRGIRVYREADVELLRHRDMLSSTPAREPAPALSAKLDRIRRLH
jgi:hypothetical protein